MAGKRILLARISLAAGLAAAGLAPSLVTRVERWRQGPTDFERDVASLDEEIGRLDAARRTDRDLDEDAATRLAYRLYQRASLTNRSEDFDRTSTLVRDVVGSVGIRPELSLLQAAVDLHFHRLDAASTALKESPELAGADGETLAADLDLQQGRYDEAQRGYEAAVRRRATWGSLARLAFLVSCRGDVEAADRLYTQAEDDLTAKEMRAFAWLEVQRGSLRFSRGRFEEARVHYRTAERAYSGYWLVDEYTAELLAAERRYPEAIARYERAIARAPRPDLFQQLGDLYLFIGRPPEARPWHQQALAAYLASAGRGEVQYLHHLVGFYTDVAHDGAAAVKWAREDAALRPTYTTLDSLAWALHQSGSLVEAGATARRALASGMVDTHLYYHAAIVLESLGDHDTSVRLMDRVHELNPRYDTFHAHR